MRMTADGTGNEMIAPGNYTHISMTSSYTYFNAFDEDDIYYRVPTSGSSDVNKFSVIAEE